MHPALSVIFFTTLSGAGYGLLFWSALACADRRKAPARTLLVVHRARRSCCRRSACSARLLHLGKPQRAWRAFSQWRTSWLSREGVAAMATFFVAACSRRRSLPALLARDGWGRGRSRRVGNAVALLAMLAARVDRLLHRDDLRLAQADPGVAPSPRAAGVSRCSRCSPAACCSARSPPRSAGRCRTCRARRLRGRCASLVRDEAEATGATSTQPLPATRGDAIGLPQAHGDCVRTSAHRGELPDARNGLRARAQARPHAAARRARAVRARCRSCSLLPRVAARRMDAGAAGTPPPRCAPSPAHSSNAGCSSPRPSTW